MSNLLRLSSEGIDSNTEPKSQSNLPQPIRPSVSTVQHKKSSNANTKVQQEETPISKIKKETNRNIQEVIEKKRQLLYNSHQAQIQEFAEYYTDKMHKFYHETLPYYITIFEELQKEWNIEKFQEDPAYYLNKYVNDGIQMDKYLVEDYRDIKTINQLQLFELNALIRLYAFYSELVIATFYFIPGADDTNSHTKTLSTSFVSRVLYHMDCIEHTFNNVRRTDTIKLSESKLAKYPHIEDYTLLSDSFKQIVVYHRLNAIGAALYTLMATASFYSLNRSILDDCADELQKKLKETINFSLE